MASDLLPTLLTQIAGGAGAAALDRYKPEWTYHVGGTVNGWGAAGDPSGVSITPGLMASIGLTALLAFLPGKITGGDSKMWKVVAANLAGGALVVEGVTLAQQKIVPYIEQQLGVGQGVHGYPRALSFMQAAPYVGHVPQPAYMDRSPEMMTTFEIQQSMAQFGRAAA